MATEYSIFTINGAMAFQTEVHGVKAVVEYGKPAVELVAVKRVVQQADGSWWQYNFYKGRSVGTPLRGKARQPYMLQFIEEVKAALNT